jgi:hypothetical protein
VSRSGYADVDVDAVLAETQLAFLLEIRGDRVWVPKSHVRDAHVYSKGERDVVMSLSEWMCDQKGIDY